MARGIVDGCARTAAMAVATLTMLLSLTIFGFLADGINKMFYATALLGSNVFLYGMVVLLSVATIAIVLTPLSIHAIVLQRHNPLPIMSMCTLMCGLLGVLACVIATCMRTDMASGGPHTWMMEGLVQEYGHTHAHIITKAYDHMQRDFQCCGVDNLSEWVDSAWYSSQTRYPQRRRPNSCCFTCKDSYEKFCKYQSKAGSKEASACETVKTYCSEYDESLVDYRICTGQDVAPHGVSVEAIVHKQSCYPIFESRIHFYTLLILIGGGALSILLIVQAAVVFSVARRMEQVLLSYLFTPVSADECSSP